MKSSMTWFVAALFLFFWNTFRLIFLVIILFSLIMQVSSEKPFNSMDYMAASPSWAVYGAEEGGFDPGQSRYRKERHHKSSR
jgi:hypothetical protein